MDSFLLDVRQSLRTLRRSPAFTLVAVATLALAVGANAAIFSLLSGIMLRPLSYPEPARLVTVFEQNPERKIPRAGVSADVYLAWHERQRSFTGLAAVVPQNGEINGVGDPLEVPIGVVSPEYFRIVGQNPLIGRTFTTAEHAEKGPQAVLISRGFWMRHFGGDPSVLSRTLILNSAARPIVGVMPDDGEWMRAIEVWAALPMDLLPRLPAGNHIFSVVGRLRERTTMHSATADLRSISEGVMAQRPERGRGWIPGLEPLASTVVNSSSRTVILTLFGAVACILLIACANLGNLTIVRSHARRREIAMRAALGSNRWRLIRGLTLESGIVALAGAGLGILLGLWLVDAIRAIAADTLPRLDAVRLDRRVLLFTAAITVGATFLFGLLPAVGGSRVELHQELRDGQRVAHSSATRDLLAIVEIALAVVLTVGAVLLLQTLGSLHRQPLGYDPSGVLALDLDLPARRFPTAESRVRLIHAIEEKVRAVPGVVAVGSTRALPLESGGPDTEFRIQGRPPDASNSQGWAYYTSISSQYLKAMGVSLLAGRHLEEADDRSGAPQVAVINQALAKKYWPDGSAVGQRLEMGPWKVEVVGVVRDLRQRFLRDDVQPQMFLPYTMEPTLQVSMVVRTAGDPSAVVPALHRAVWDVDPNLPLEEWTMDALMRMATAQSRLTTMMVGAFAGLAILLALIGVYGVVSYGVSLRRHELGVRMALGATRVRVLTLVLSKGVALGGIGIALGTAGAIGVARGFQGLLFGVGPADPATLAASAIAIAAVTLAASLIPALRAARLDPLVALRTE